MSKHDRKHIRTVPRSGSVEQFADFMDSVDLKKLDLGVRELKERNRCDFCGGTPREFGIFVAGPLLSQRMLLPRGETAMVPYSLCRDCFALPGAMDQYENGLRGWADHIAGSVDRN